jgi:hypothetical protein
LTHWFTWLEAVEYYKKNLEAIEEIVQAFPDTDSAALCSFCEGNCEGC